MSLTYALLACLNEGPATGYELFTRFGRSMGHVWNASHQQIYRELSKLLEQQWVDVTLISQTKKPDRKLYQVTQAGIAALTSWANQTCNPSPVRNTLLLKFFAGTVWTNEAIAHELHQHEQNWQQKLVVYEAIERQYFSDPALLPRNDRLKYIALRRGIIDLQACLAWSREVSDFLF